VASLPQLEGGQKRDPVGNAPNAHIYARRDKAEGFAAQY